LNKEAQSSASVPSYIGQPGNVSKATSSFDSSKPGRSHPLPPVKNFNAFMQQTDNEWDDALDDVNNSNLPEEEKEVTPDVPVFQKRVHTKTSRPGTPSALETNTPSEQPVQSPRPSESKRKNTNGLKDNIPDLITGERKRGHNVLIFSACIDTKKAHAKTRFNSRSVQFIKIVHSRCE
jgi:hypothetical protein